MLLSQQIWPLCISPQEQIMAELFIKLPLDMSGVTELLPDLYEKAHQIVWWAFVCK
jgi:hypothetical protein